MKKIALFLLSVVLFVAIDLTVLDTGIVAGALIVAGKVFKR